MKQFSQACDRNKKPIGDVLAEILPTKEDGLVVEIGSGTGQHGAYFASRFPNIQWQPTDRPGILGSIQAWRREAGLDNLLSPREFDLFDEDPPVEAADLVVAINVLHIAPVEATDRLFFHASKMLNPGAHLFVYGPFRFADRKLEASNERFDAFLQKRNPQSGLRLFEDVDESAEKFGFTHVETRRLPANNHAIWWSKN